MTEDQFQRMQVLITGKIARSAARITKSVDDVTVQAGRAAAGSDMTTEQVKQLSGIVRKLNDNVAALSARLDSVDKNLLRLTLDNDEIVRGLRSMTDSIVSQLDDEPSGPIAERDRAQPG